MSTVTGLYSRFGTGSKSFGSTFAKKVVTVILKADQMLCFPTRQALTCLSSTSEVIVEMNECAQKNSGMNHRELKKINVKQP